MVELFPEDGVTDVGISFRGVVQAGADTGFRWGLVATDASLTTARYGQLHSGTSGDTRFCVADGERLFLVVTATPTAYQKIVWEGTSDGTPYPSIYRYPYMIELDGAWPEGFVDGMPDACPSGTVRHANGGGCAPSGTPSSVYVGPYARVLGGTVSGNTRIEDQATIVNGTVSGGTVGALSLVGMESNWHHGAASFNVSDSATLRSTFYPMGWFGANNKSISGTATYIGDMEVYSVNKSSNTFYGLVNDDWSGVSSVSEVTITPPYSWY